MNDTGHWDDSLVGEFDPTKFFGFIYLIEDRDTGRAYIGKKFFKHKRQKTLKNKSRTKESDWKHYNSSCEELCEAIAERGASHFFFKILRLCSGRCELSYTEQELQFAHDVLRARLPNGEHKYYNKTIAHFNFAGLEKQTAESRRLTSRPS
jgi:hypothetical protein